jgi:hypothetical protein
VGKVSKEFKEWFKVIEIADMLGLSKVTIYNKIKTLNSDTLQSLQKKEKGITYYNYKIVDMIREIDGQQQEENADIPPDEIAAAIASDKYLDLYISELKGEIDYLRDQIKNKDDLINKQLKIVENEQVLRREERQTAALLEEARAVQADEKITTWRELHDDSKESKEGTLQRLKRFFKK